MSVATTMTQTPTETGTTINIIKRGLLRPPLGLNMTHGKEIVVNQYIESILFSFCGTIGFVLAFYFIISVLMKLDDGSVKRRNGKNKKMRKRTSGRAGRKRNRKENEFDDADADSSNEDRIDNPLSRRLLRKGDEDEGFNGEAVSILRESVDSAYRISSREIAAREAEKNPIAAANYIDAIDSDEMDIGGRGDITNIVDGEESREEDTSADETISSVPVSNDDSEETYGDHSAYGDTPTDIDDIDPADFLPDEPKNIDMDAIIEKYLGGDENESDKSEYEDDIPSEVPDTIFDDDGSNIGEYHGTVVTGSGISGSMSDETGGQNNIPEDGGDDDFDDYVTQTVVSGNSLDSSQKSKKKHRKRRPRKSPQKTGNNGNDKKT